MDVQRPDDGICILCDTFAYPQGAFAQSTFSPNSQWLKQQLRQVIWECEDKKMTPKFFLHDNDKCYSIDFDSMLKAFDIKAIKTPFQAQMQTPTRKDLF